MAEIAARYDTAVARAMRAALGRLGYACRARSRAYGGLRWCFRNEDAPTPYKRRVGV